LRYRKESRWKRKGITDRGGTWILKSTWSIQVIGGSIAVGALFTTPMATLFLMSVFEERTGGTPSILG